MILFGYIAITAHRSLPCLGLHVAVVAVAGEVHHAHPVDGPRVPALLLGLGLLVAAEEGVHPLRRRGLAARPAASALVTLLGDVAVIRIVVPLLLVGVGLVPLSLMVIIVSLKTKIQSGRLARLLSLIVWAAWLA